jgi:hypothetical protein
MDKLRNLSLSASEAQREAVDNLLSHLSVIVRLREAQSTLLQDIAQIPVAAKIDGFNNMLSERFQKKLTQQFAYQRVLLGYSALALFLVRPDSSPIATRPSAGALPPSSTSKPPSSRKTMCSWCMHRK